MLASIESYTAHLPRISCPEGYTINWDGRCPSFLLPTGENQWVPAHWVRMHQDGKVEGLPYEWSPEDVPYMADLFTVLLDALEDDNPVLPLGPWLCQMLKGPAVLYGPLLQAVRETGDWGLQAEVQRFRAIEHSLVDCNRRMELLKAEQRRLQECQDVGVWEMRARERRPELPSITRDRCRAGLRCAVRCSARLQISFTLHSHVMGTLCHFTMSSFTLY